MATSADAFLADLEDLVEDFAPQQNVHHDSLSTLMGQTVDESNDVFQKKEEPESSDGPDAMDVDGELYC